MRLWKWGEGVEKRGSVGREVQCEQVQGGIKPKVSGSGHWGLGHREQVEWKEYMLSLELCGFEEWRNFQACVCDYLFPLGMV